MAHDVSGYVKLPEGVAITTFMNHLAKWMMGALSEMMTWYDLIWLVITGIIRIIEHILRLVGGLEHEFYEFQFPFHILYGMSSFPLTMSHSFQRGWFKPPTSIWVVLCFTIVLPNIYPTFTHCLSTKGWQDLHLVPLKHPCCSWGCHRAIQIWPVFSFQMSKRPHFFTRHSANILKLLVGYQYMCVSENRLVPLNPVWFCWSLSLWKMAISLGILTQHFQTNPYHYMYCLYARSGQRLKFNGLQFKILPFCFWSDGKLLFNSFISSVMSVFFVWLKDK